MKLMEDELNIDALPAAKLYTSFPGGNEEIRFWWFGDLVRTDFWCFHCLALRPVMMGLNNGWKPSGSNNSVR
jgi:hypothetical protein